MRGRKQPRFKATLIWEVPHVRRIRVSIASWRLLPDGQRDMVHVLAVYEKKRFPLVDRRIFYKLVHLPPRLNPVIPKLRAKLRAQKLAWLEMPDVIDGVKVMHFTTTIFPDKNT